MLRVGLVAAVLSAGCFSTPSFHGQTSGDDGGDGGSCTPNNVDAAPAVVKTDAPESCTWRTPVTLEGSFSGEVSGQPTMDSAMTLMVWDYGPDGTTNALHWAEKSAQDTAWAVHDDALLDTGDNGADMDPTLNDAGDVLFFVSNQNSTPLTVYEAHHTNCGWDTPKPIETLTPIEDIFAIDAIGEGNTLYVVNTGGVMYRLTRPDRATKFTVGPAIASGARYPGVSPDELTVYQSETGTHGFDVYHRSSPTAAFPTMTSEPVLFGPPLEISDAKILADGVHMLVTKNLVTAAMSTCQ
ncbi:MAG TPA: hypothetical protein VGM39_23070 [Kofleriaceae bacterium]|jgi:hypothetical protein